MLLERLTLCDFGLFRGEHAIDLNPRKKYSSIRPIILFGGLNGAGKTTILTAIRLVIYGKQSLGYATSQKAYEEFLASKIHRNSNSLVNPNAAHVALEFLYYKLGQPTKYKIIRSWVHSGKQLNETLTILQDGEVLPNFSQEQCQAFLNELIPLGVSDLFFFDGEKIASLAEDGGDVALRDAIRKLLGLDIIERLKSDLHIYIRRQNNKFLPQDIQKQLRKLEEEYTAIKLAIKNEEAASQEVLPKLIAAKEQLGRLEESLAAKGGAWAVSRQALKARREKLLGEKKLIEGEIRDHLNGLFPLSLAPKLMQQLKEQIQTEKSYKDWDSISQAISHRLDQLSSILTEFVPQAKHSDAQQSVQSVFSDLLTRPQEYKDLNLIHDLASKDYLRLENWINEALSHVRSKSDSLHKHLNTIDEELGSVSVQIERAPDQETLQSDLDAIKQQNAKISSLSSERNTHLELARRHTWQAIDLVRKIRKLEEQLEAGDMQGTGADLAKQSREVLSKFAEEMTKRKIIKLEQEFANTFSRLARKSDSIIRVQIDPSTFEVHLFSKGGKGIPKQDLSAGEKQIYAVAMLEALAKTSGRKLPIIIDTPLGRLDSRHREKLINNYFPHASHQVVILSTDTEVDKNFYENLNKHVSHCYHIEYDENEGSSEVKEGYFWKSSLDNGAITHAS